MLPGGVTVKQEYNAAGYQYQTIADGTVISEIKAMDDAGRVTQAAFVGGSKRSVEYTPERGFIKNIEVQDGLNKTLYTVDYGYSLRGDTKSRLSKYSNGTSSTIVDENYTYSTDGHFRLEQREVVVTAPQVLGNLVTPMSQSFSYDSLGNLKTKSGVGTYEYDSTNPYLLRKTTGATGSNRNYAIPQAVDEGYDTHGNLLADGQRTFAYNQADMVMSIAKGTDSTKFEYAPDNSRIYREDTRSGSVTKTWYVGKTYEYSEKGSDTEQRWYLGNVVMSQSSKTSGTNFEVLHGDAQGSTVTVTDGSGNLVSHSLYDAWGQQSVLQVGPTSQLFIQSLQRRGYTGHENVEGLGIIHMNGRIYDPLLARFVQADPTLQFTQLSQGYNRYSYVLNNPMTYTDPSGYFLSGLKNFVKKYWKAAVAIAVVVYTAGAATNWVSTWGASWGTAATAATATTAGTAATLTTTGSMLVGSMAGAAGGFVGGGLQTGKLSGALRGAVTGAISGAAGGFANAGAVSGWGDAATRIGASALGGCAAGEVSGSGCAKGARMAALTQTVTMGASAVYRKLSSKISKQTGQAYNEDGTPHFGLRGQSDVGKQLNETLSKHYWGPSDQAGVMQDIAKGPYMDSFAEFHDGLHDMFSDVLGKGDIITNNGISLILTMPHSYGLTLLAAANPYNHAYTSYKLMSKNN